MLGAPLLDILVAFGYFVSGFQQWKWVTLREQHWLCYGNVFLSSSKWWMKIEDTASKLGIILISAILVTNHVVSMAEFVKIVPLILLGAISKRWCIPGWWHLTLTASWRALVGLFLSNWDHIVLLIREISCEECMCDLSVFLYLLVCSVSY